jgi:hypothetical protein
LTNVDSGSFGGTGHGCVSVKTVSFDSEDISDELCPSNLQTLPIGIFCDGTQCRETTASSSGEFNVFAIV